MILEEILNQITLIKSKTNYSISHIEMSTDKYEEFKEEVEYLSSTQRDFFEKELSEFFLKYRVYNEDEVGKYDVELDGLKDKQYIVVTNNNIKTTRIDDILEEEIVDLVVIVGSRGDF